MNILVGVALVVKTRDELKGIGSRLGEIRDELGHEMTATMQGWERKRTWYVYLLVLRERNQ